MRSGPPVPVQYRSVKSVRPSVKNPDAYWVTLSCGHAYIKDGPTGQAYADGITNLMACPMCRRKEEKRRR